MSPEKTDYTLFFAFRGEKLCEAPVSKLGAVTVKNSLSTG